MLYLVFLSIMLPFAVILYGRLVAPHKLQRRWRFFWGSLIVTFTALVTYALPLTLQMARNPDAYSGSFFVGLLPWMYYAMTLLFILIVFIVLRDLLWLFAWIARLVRSLRTGSGRKQT